MMDKKYPLIFSVILLMFACLCVNQERVPEPSTTLEKEASVPATTSPLQTEEKTTTSKAAEATTTVTDTTREAPKTADLYYREALRSYNNQDYESAMELANQALHGYNQTADKNGVLKCSALIKEINKHKKDMDDQIRGSRLLEGNETYAIETPPEAYANVKKALGYLSSKGSPQTGLAKESTLLAMDQYERAGNINGTFACTILLRRIESRAMFN
jgi:hypothetical protein